MQNSNHNHTWNTQVNLAGVSTAGGGMKVKEGYYNAVLTEAYIDNSRNPDRVVMKVTFSDPAVNGASRFNSMYLPGKTPSGKDNRMYWRAVLESVGYQPAQLEGQLNLSAQALVNRPCTVYYRPKDPNAIAGSDQYDQLSFLAPHHWKAKKAAFESQAATSSPASTLAAPSPASGSPTITASSAGFSPPNMSPQDLLSMAGLSNN